MEDINKYIGIPYKFNGRDFDGVDCLGLAYLFYKEHGWLELDDGLPIEKDKWHKGVANRIMRFFKPRFDITKDANELKFGDVVIFDYGGCAHFGIMLEYGKLLSTQIVDSDENSHSTIYHRAWWTPFFRIGFRRRDNGNISVNSSWQRK